MDLDDEKIPNSQAFLALHGALNAVIVTLIKSGHLRVDPLLEQMRYSAAVLTVDGQRMAAALLHDQIEALAREYPPDEPVTR